MHLYETVKFFVAAFWIFDFEKTTKNSKFKVKIYFLDDKNVKTLLASLATAPFLRGGPYRFLDSVTYEK